MLLLVVLLTRWLVRCCCWLLDAPDVVEAPLALPLLLLDVEPELEVELDPEVEVWASARVLCSANAVTASAAKLMIVFMVVLPLQKRNPVAPVGDGASGLTATG